MKYLIGVSGFYHDSSVCLVADDQVIAFIKEESLTRVKGSSGFPYRSLDHLKSTYALNNQTVEAVSFYEKPLKAWTALISHSLTQPQSAHNLIAHHAKQFWRGPLSFKVKFDKCLKLDTDKFIYAPHHLSHVLTAQCYMPSDGHYSSVLHFVFDAVGDGDSISVYSGMHADTRLLHNIKFPHSLGLFYSALAQVCGFAVNDGEYKFMALSSFGDPQHFKHVFDNLIMPSGPELKLNMDWFSFDKRLDYGFSEKLATSLGGKISPCNLVPGTEEFKRAANIAAAAQQSLETSILHIIKFWIDEFKPVAITVSGGVAQNSVAMSKVIKNFPDLVVTIPPSPGDSGAALGAVNYASLVCKNRGIRVKKLAFKVTSQSRSNLSKELFSKISKKPTEAISLAASLITSGEHVCLFSKKMEIGPRALGFRSIICSAKKSDAVRRLNVMIKGREEYRPLAPVCLDSVATRFFKISTRSKHNHMWMASTVFVNDDFPDEYQSALHIDRSARLQIVNSDAPLLEAILVELKGKEDLLINTSLNVAGDPIAFDLIDAFANMKRMGLKYLLSEDGLFCLNEDL